MPSVTARNHSFDVLVTPEDGQFSALCLTADIASCGRTEAEALTMITEAIELYVADLTDHEIATLPPSGCQPATLRRG
jgi:predicted RNase H-like HicB family nuclease